MGVTRRHVLAGSAAVAGSALAWGAHASDGARPGGNLRVAVNETIDTFDPFTTNGGLVRTMHSHIFGQLYTYDDRYALIPELASGHEIDAEGKVWTITLQEGVKFHDGSMLGAEDVVASWERYVKISPRGPGLAKGLTAVRAAGPRTVVFEFSESPGPFLDKLSTPQSAFKILPRAVARAAADRPLGDKEMIGTGPFMLKRWQRGVSLVMARFDGYRPDTRYEGPSGLGGRRTAYLDEITWIFVSEAGAHDAGLRSGRFDLASAVPTETRAALEATRGFAGTIIKPFNWSNLILNHHKAPLDKLAVRRAMQIGIDQRAVMLGAIGDPDLIRLSPGLAYPEQIWFSSAGEQFYNRNDKAAARKLLAEAGYAGEEIVLMTTRTMESLYKCAVIIQQELTSIGFKVRLEVLDLAAMLAHITKPELREKWHLSSMEHNVRHDAYGWDLNFRSDKWTPYVNPVLDKKLDGIATLLDFKQRYALFEDVQRIFHEDVINIKSGDYFAWHPHRSYVKGYKSYNGFVFWNVWLEK